MRWYISSLVNEWEWCILESDTGILGKKEIQVHLLGIEPKTFRLLALPLSYRRLVGAKAIKLGSWDKHPVAQW